MSVNNDVVEAMYIVGGRIHTIGGNALVESVMDSKTRVIDLQGRTLLPGFIDAHSHFPASGIRAVSVDLAPPPIGQTGSIDELLRRVQQAAEKQTDGAWILGYNYDNTALSGGEHPTRKQLDEIAPEVPVYLYHSSGHMGVANSKALEALSIDENSVVPFGGTYGVDRLTRKLNGLLQEKATPPLSLIINQYSYKQQLGILTSARDEYLAAGVTTVQNGYAGKNQMRVLRAAQNFGLLPQRVVVWPAHGKQAVTHKPSNPESGGSDYFIGAVKVLVDGSPQGMTAFLSEPYFDTRNHPEAYRGFALVKQSRLEELVAKYHRAGYQLALHGNGDAAIEQIILAVENAQAEFVREDARHIIVHAQTIREDQIKRLKALSMTPSFFNTHTYYWGDWHRTQSLGPERASNISPTRWAQQADIRFSLHTDAPVTPIDPMQLLWSATRRETLSGIVLGEHQRIDMQSALRALTIDAAWQNHLEHDLGSLEEGKLADMVELSHNPFDVDDVRQIKVLSTYINGVKHYARPHQ